MNISSTTAQVAPDLSKVQAIISDTSVRRSAVDWEDLNLYWKSEKRPIIFKFFKDFTNFKKKTSWAVVFGHSLKCMIKHSFFQMKGFFLGYLSILLNYERRNRKISKALALIWPKTSMMMHHGHQCAKNQNDQVIPPEDMLIHWFENPSSGLAESKVILWKVFQTISFDWKCQTFF